MIPIRQQNTVKKFPIKQLNGQICLVPFTSIAIEIDGDVRLCECQAWMPTVVGNLFENTIQEILSNKISEAIRKSISTGTYEYCNEYTCGVIVNKQLITVDLVLSAYQDHIKNPSTFSMPNIIRIGGDMTCNLSCPSCRTHVIKTDSSQMQQQEQLAGVIRKNLFNQPTDKHMILHVSTSGEIFASPFLLKFVSGISFRDFPNLDIHLQTNGLLAPKNWYRLGEMQHRVKKITVTTDAAKEITYEKLRRGGKWRDIQAALSWISQKKLENNMQISMRMVVQQGNYLEIEDFYNQAKSIGADIVEYGRLSNWGTYGPGEFAKHDVFDPSHSEYHTAQACLDKVKQYPDTFLCGGIA